MQNEEKGWYKIKEECPRCKGRKVKKKEDDRGDAEYYCPDCKKHWYLDGPDY